MATIAATVVHLDNIKTCKWETLVTGSLDGTPFKYPEFADRSIMVTGTWDTATLVIEGSNDGGASWDILQEPDGTDLSFTSGTPLKQVGELTEEIRPLASSTGTSTDLDVFLIARRTSTARQ